MSAKEPKLLYQSKQFRFRVLLHREYCQQHPIPQEEIIQRCKLKISQLMSEKIIEDHVFNEAKYRQIWELLSKPECQVESVALTVGLGIPSLKWLVIKQGGSGALCKVSLHDSQAALALGIHSFIMIVKRKLERANIKELPNESQLQACFLRSASEWPVENIPITAQQPFSESQNKSVTVSVNKSRLEVSLLIRDSKAFLSVTEESLLSLGKKSALALSEETGVEVKTSPEIFKEIWKEFSTGPMALGIGIPKAVVIAYGKWVSDPKLPSPLPGPQPSPTRSNSLSETKRPTSEKESQQAQKSDLEMNVSDNDMIARVVSFQKSIYENKNLVLNEEWLELQIAKLKLAQESFIPYKSQLLFALESQKDLTGMTLATGELGVAGEEPYLHPSYKHAREKFIKEHEGDFIDLRNLQSSEIVKPGDLVAEILYRTPAKPGRDIFGKVLDPPAGAGLKITTGPGLQAKKGGRFFATEPGTPVIRGLSISLQKIYVHQGDVSLKSGNIVYDGPIEIRGNIDRGASVIGTGPISIYGNVEGGIVKSQTSIFVEGGVITTDQGRLEAVGNIEAYHIENSRIHCGGILKVEKTLLNSNVFAGIGIEVSPADGGIIAGGKLAATGHLYTFNLGLKNGTKTFVNIGCDWKNEYSTQIAEARLERVTQASERDRANLRDLAGRKATSLAKKHIEMKAELQKRLIKSRRIMEKLTNRIQSLKSKISVNPNAEIIVHNLLFATSQIKIGNKSAPIANDYREVAITPKLGKEGYIISLEEFLEAKKTKAQALEIANKK
ncbi:MAG: FapA family protein [Pseudomonadota bacterium]